MWNDVEATTDLLNFSVVAEVAAQIIRDSGDNPVSIGISGSWGVGKSSLVKMIGRSLEQTPNHRTKYVFVEFNAWLYQGYEDARMALLQAVSDALTDYAKEEKKPLEKAFDFAKRIRWLKVGKLIAPTVIGALAGGVAAGPVGALFTALAAFKSAESPSAEDLEKVKDAYAEVQPELAELLKEKGEESLPKEIQGLRDSFEALLKDLGITLVVLVDDLDRCMPDTAISTLEAMRLLLFLPRTAFIIAADEQMIRAAVRKHFDTAGITDELVTSYFDKLIQVPLKVPRLGANEVKAYLILLLLELAERRSQITAQAYQDSTKKIRDALKQSWLSGLTHRVLQEAMGSEADKVSTYIDMADQMAPVMATSDQIAGNPRLIKRFLNNLMIRDSIAKAQGMSVSFEALVKLQLFERCASPAAFEFLSKNVAQDETGQAKFLAEVEDAIKRGEDYKAPDASWDSPFIVQWLKLTPPLGEMDLRPLLYLSRDRAIALSSYDDLSADGKALMEALFGTDAIDTQIIQRLQALGETESERILVRLGRKARAEQWSIAALTRCLNVTRAFPMLGKTFVSVLTEIPAKTRSPAFIPLIGNEDWARDLLAAWSADSDTPPRVKKAINLKIGGS